ncbi:16955_t:CDS:2 [Funneliformis geosporum]|uniref:16955_t:CDS:1 n=1 Tax=Funneliformis geosporum TaxID=1117311 RepID=A0A9W4WN90_9GLOM|nr:16955_t:CDS:2 [Funneliformis geosporum]
MGEYGKLEFYVTAIVLAEQLIYLFGGLSLNATNQVVIAPSVHALNLNSLSWNIPNIEGIPPNRRRNIRSVFDNVGNMYIFGGLTGPYFDLPKSMTIDEMVILNPVKLSWIINAIKSRHLYSATLLTNGIIIYIGGFEVEIADIKQIILYDTNSLTWSERIATTSSLIENRSGHTAVLAIDIFSNINQIALARSLTDQQGYRVVGNNLCIEQIALEGTVAN